MEAARPAMQPLAPLETERDRRDGQAYHDRTAPSVSSTHSSSVAPNHATSHAQGYVSPYSQGSLSSLTHLANAASKEFGTPPDSRRASGEDKDAIAAPNTRQSLPSISEALGIDNNAIPFPQAATQASQAGAASASKVPSPVSTMRIYAAEPPQPHGESHSSKYGSMYSQVPSSYSADAPRPSTSDPRPALHVHTPQASQYSQPSSHAYSNPSPAHDRPPATSFPYGYQPYPPRYAQTGHSSSSGAPVYHASAGSRGWEAENASPRYSSVEKSYGESVKRHLDLYDLESALNDISSASTFLGDFSRRYGDLLHQSPRSGLTLGSLPSIVEIEDMIAKSRTQTEALIKISGTVLARQAAHDEHKAEMRQKAYSDYDDGLGDDDAKGPDAKKRRGRAAPPGRCHSCNRAETPEWRRGPDGARTLCNACGLHYAKLTRKANNAGKATSVSSSNLRPKDN